MTYKLPIHSYIDVITNSSTEIYVSVHDNTLKMMKNFIENIMLSTGVTGKFDDYFELSIVKDESFDDSGISNLIIKYKNNKHSENLNNTMQSIFNIVESYG